MFKANILKETEVVNLTENYKKEVKKIDTLSLFRILFRSFGFNTKQQRY